MTRDAERIDRVLETLETVWKKHPDLRLCQLLVNAAPLSGPCPELFYIEDQTLEKLLHELDARISKERPSGE